ncbi:MAG TPA: hypothetical protein VMI56_01720 [Reyranella sp.]|nr:hypothetical protein [Reyranella sp.]
MIQATGSIDALQLSIDGAPITVLNHNKRGFALDGRDFTVRRSGAFTPRYELLRADELLVTVQQAPFVNRFTVTCADRTWLLKAEGLAAKTFGLFEGETRVGGITPSSTFRSTRDVVIDLPATLPLEGQVFLMWVVLWKWGAAG